MTNKRFYDHAAAEVLGWSVHTLRRKRYHGGGPVFYRVDGRIVYLESDLYAFLEKCRVDPRPKPLQVAV